MNIFISSQVLIVKFFISYNYLEIKYGGIRMESKMRTCMFVGARGRNEPSFIINNCEAVSGYGWLVSLMARVVAF